MNRTTKALVTGLLLAVSATGCTNEVANRSTRPTTNTDATTVPLPNLCDLASQIAPSLWEADNFDDNPYPTGPNPTTAHCTFDSGYDAPTHTAVIVSWNPAADKVASNVDFAEECQRVSTIARGSATERVDTETFCQAITSNPNDDAWTYLAFRAVASEGVLALRVDTTEPTTEDTLLRDSRRFVQELDSLISAE